MNRNKLNLGIATAVVAVLIMSLSACSSSNPVSPDRAIVFDNSTGGNGNDVPAIGIKGPNEERVTDAYSFEDVFSNEEPFHSSTPDIDVYTPGGTESSHDRATDADFLEKEQVYFKSTPEIGSYTRGSQYSSDDTRVRDILDEDF